MRYAGAFKFLFLGLGLAVGPPGANALADDDVMVVSADPVGQDDLWDVTIVSRSDALNVSRIAVNQNNCKGTVQLRAQLPVMLRFGESFRYRVFPCHPIQVAVEANGRTELFDFGEPIDPGTDLGVSADLYGGSKSLYNKLVVTSYSET